MPAMTSNKLSENARNILFARNYTKEILNFRPLTSVNTYDPEYTAYLTAKHDESFLPNGLPIEQGIALDLVNFLDSKKDPKYAAAAKEVFDCLTDYTRLNVLLNVQSPAELDEKRMKQINTCISRLTGADGVHPGFSAALAALNTDSGYEFCATNEMKTLTHMVGHVDALATDLEAISIADRNRTLDTLTNRTGELKQSLEAYENHVAGMMDEVHADNLTFHPDDIEGAAERAARKSRETSERISALVAENAKLENARRIEREKIADKEDSLKFQLAYIASVEKDRTERLKQIASVNDITEKMVIKAQEAQNALDENKQNIRNTEEQLAAIPGRRQEILSAVTKAGLPKKSITVIEECESRMAKIAAFEKNGARACSATPEDCNRLRTAEGRKQMIAEGGDKARTAQMIEDFAKLQNELHPKGFFGRTAPADAAVNRVIDAYQASNDSSLDTCVHNAIREEKNAQIATAAKNAGVKASALSTILNKLEKVEDDRKQLTEDLARYKGRTLNLNDQAAFYKDEAEKYGKQLETLDHDNERSNNYINSANKTIDELKAGIAENNKKIQELDKIQEKNQAELDREGENRRQFDNAEIKLRGYATELNEDVENRRELQSKLNAFTTNPALNEIGPDDRSNRIMSRIQAFRDRSNENKSFGHINTGSYNNMIRELDNVLNDPDPAKLSENLQQLKQKAREYQIAKGTPTFGSRSSFGMMRLSYAQEIINFCTSARDMLAENPAAVPVGLAEDSKMLAAKNLDRDHPSLKTRMAAAATVRIPAAQARTAAKAAEKTENRELNAPV